MGESDSERRARLRRGHLAGRVLLGCLVAFDLVFLLGTITHPTWWRFAIFVVPIAPQLHHAIGLWTRQPEDHTTTRSGDEPATRSTASRG